MSPQPKKIDISLSTNLNKAVDDEMKKLCGRSKLSIKAQKNHESSVAKYMSALIAYPVESR